MDLEAIDTEQTMTDELERFTSKLYRAIGQSLEGLPAADLLDRIAWCQANDDLQFWVNAGSADDLLEVWWGGRPLMMAPRDIFAGEGDLPEATWIGEVPDDASGLSG